MVESFEVLNDSSKRAIERNLPLYQYEWSAFDPGASGFINPSQITRLIEQLPAPFGATLPAVVNSARYKQSSLKAEFVRMNLTKSHVAPFSEVFLYLVIYHRIEVGEMKGKMWVRELKHLQALVKIVTSIKLWVARSRAKKKRLTRAITGIPTPPSTPPNETLSPNLYSIRQSFDQLDKLVATTPSRKKPRDEDRKKPRDEDVKMTISLAGLNHYTMMPTFESKLSPNAGSQRGGGAEESTGLTVSVSVGSSLSATGEGKQIGTLRRSRSFDHGGAHDAPLPNFREVRFSAMLPGGSAAESSKHVSPVQSPDGSPNVAALRKALSKAEDRLTAKKRLAAVAALEEEDSPLTPTARGKSPPPNAPATSTQLPSPPVSAKVQVAVPVRTFAVRRRSRSPERAGRAEEDGVQAKWRAVAGAFGFAESDHEGDGEASEDGQQLPPSERPLPAACVERRGAASVARVSQNEAYDPIFNWGPAVVGVLADLLCAFSAAANLTVDVPAGDAWDPNGPRPEGSPAGPPKRFWAPPEGLSWAPESVWRLGHQSDDAHCDDGCASRARAFS